VLCIFSALRIFARLYRLMQRASCQVAICNARYFDLLFSFHDLTCLITLAKSRPFERCSASEVHAAILSCTGWLAVEEQKQVPVVTYGASAAYP
jgi:hypothetical protein